MANNFALLRSFHLLLSTSFCLHVSLEWSINFVYEILLMKYNDLRKFSARNIFVRKRNDEIFHTNYLEFKLTQTKIRLIMVPFCIPIAGNIDRE